MTQVFQIPGIINEGCIGKDFWPEMAEMIAPRVKQCLHERGNNAAGHDNFVTDLYTYYHIWKIQFRAVGNAFRSICCNPMIGSQGQKKKHQ